MFLPSSTTETPTISGCENSDFKGNIGTYHLQVGPDKFDISLGEEKAYAGKDGKGIKQVPNDPPNVLRNLSISFIIDNTGLLPKPPDGCSGIGTDIGPSIEKLKKLTMIPHNETHRKPFVVVKWDKLNLQGVCTAFKLNYTFFKDSTPLRAKIELNFTESKSTSNPLFRSPDISRIPTIKEGDNLIQFCEKFYDNRELYIKIAEINNLPSFRRLKEGQSIQFPPIKK